MPVVQSVFSPGDGDEDDDDDDEFEDAREVSGKAKILSLDSRLTKWLLRNCKMIPHYVKTLT